MVRWEALALTLAADTGIEVPKWRLVPQMDRQSCC